jgi:thiamine-monophosphate kinase
VLRVPPGHEALVTSDFSLEGIHFRREWHPPESVGHRCLTRGLSDIAAMGGEPIAAFLSLALPAKLPQSWADRFLDGLLRLSAKAGVVLAGGDTAESPSGVMADIVVLGSAPRGKAILRSSARPGHRIYVTGELGGAAATLDLLSKGKKRLAPKGYSQHFFPAPRLDVGQVLSGQRLVSSMIDISDGLSTDLMHICEESGVGAEIKKQAIPVARIGKPRRRVDVRFALHGGEDYELLFTAPPHKRIPARIGRISITEIGCITHGKKIFIRNSDGSLTELDPQGWEHFTNPTNLGRVDDSVVSRLCA